MKTLHLVATVLLILTFSTVPSLAQCGGMGGHGSHQGHQQHEAAPSVSVATSIAAYPLSYCLVTGEPLGSRGDPVIRTYNGHQIKFCCQECPAKFERDQELYLGKLEETIIASQKDTYPLEKCVVSGERLDSMGEPYDYVYANELVRFCCVGCVPKFEQDPDRYLKKLHKSSGAKATPPKQGGSNGPQTEHSHH